jgi:cytidyltransferase-like protein
VRSGHTKEGWGCVTGRFQPPHEGHLELIELALDRHSSIVIGITNPDAASRIRHDANPRRHLAGANPFTYFERVLLLRALMEWRGVDPRRYVIVPFWLGRDETRRSYLPSNPIQYVRVYSDWERRKVELLRGSGYLVHVIEPSTPKARSAGAIREAMVAGGRWHEMVPPPTVGLLDVFLEELSIEERCAP